MMDRLSFCSCWIITIVTVCAHVHYHVLVVEAAAPAQPSPAVDRSRHRHPKNSSDVWMAKSSTSSQPQQQPQPHSLLEARPNDVASLALETHADTFTAANTTTSTPTTVTDTPTTSTTSTTATCDSGTATSWTSPQGKAVATTATRKGQTTTTTTKIRLPLYWAIASGIVLAFNSGYLNGCCLAGVIVAQRSQGVAAVTGSLTTGALAWAAAAAAGGSKHPPKSPLPQWRTPLAVIFSFLGGSFVAGWLNPRPVAFELSPTLGPTFLLGAVSLYLSSLGVTTGSTSSSSSSSAFYWAAAANGLQNSVTSVHTANMMRSSHFSGITSDIGTYMGQLLRGNRQNVQRLCINIALAVAFWTGGVVSFFAAASAMHPSALLLLSAGLYAAIGVALVTLQLAAKELT